MSLLTKVARLTVMTIVIGAARSDAGAQTNASNSLYKRIGGYDAIAAMTDDFLGRLVTHPLLAPTFKGNSVATKTRIRQLIIDQICQKTGGPCIYLGRDTKTAHTGIGVTQEQWDVAARVFSEVLDRFNVAAKEKGELLDMFASFKTDIVEKTM